MSIQPILIAGKWRAANAASTFRSVNPATKEPLSDEYPVSSWQDCEEALNSAACAAQVMREMSGERIADFLEAYANQIETRKDALVDAAHAETALPKSPRLADVELPRTTNQLRLAAAAAREGTWRKATIDSETNIRSALAPLGPVCVFGPNNFPFAFNSISGGDFAAAIAAGNPVIAKGNSSHPETTRLFGEAAQNAADKTNMPVGVVQLLYRTSHEDGEKLVSDPRVGATGYTGSRSAGLKLKAAADATGKPIYLELSSINPVAILPSALEERLEKIADEFTTSCLMGTGQFCTNPGVVILLKGRSTDAFLSTMKQKFEQAPAGTLLSEGVQTSLEKGVQTLKQSGAETLVEAAGSEGKGYSRPNTLLKVSGEQFLAHPEDLQTEAFGNSSLFVIAEDASQAEQVIDALEGNLTGCVYSHTGGADDELYDRLARRLRRKVGRLLNDKMPTGVAVSPAMNHGGPYPATGHPGFTAVGIPAALERFAMLECYDNVRPHRLPVYLQDKNPNGVMWRYIDGEWTRCDV